MQHEEIGSDANAGPSSYHAGPAIQPPPGMSKNAAKKLARKQKLEATKHERRAAERLKKKENRRVRHLAAQQDAELNDLDRATDASQPAAKRSRLEHTPSQAATKQFFDARLVIDCGFDELMVEKEASSMTQQLMYLYSANRNAKMPFGEIILIGQDAPRDCLRDVHPDQLSLVPDAASTSQPETQAGTSFASSASIENNSIGRAMDGKLRGVWRRWKRVTIYKHGGIESLLSQQLHGDPQTPSLDAAEDSDHVKKDASGRHPASEEIRQTRHRIRRSDAIYLTADTEDTLTELEPGKTYIIGGIVDKNRYKGLCRAKADRLGIRAAKLPLSQDMMRAVERNLSARGETLEDEVGTAGKAEQSFVGRKVLTVNQVVEILAAWTETRDWVQALEIALPRRKLKQRGPAAQSTTSAAGIIVDTELVLDEDAARNAS
ncbi:uncharacterized conserved protein [Moesziomyces antarcticus T-34]|uniref:tRNA (guanine(9)-N1)-methyltransferase n=1 Tax=Pseudozyma antarctica (strain T-34) TaxID=1151754 RepID=M9LWZ1_PSEA3|nr:uncharacterized conserved protein [Moesziomyces antarcticus T-34]